MSHTARLLRWTATSISFWKRSNTDNSREMEITLVSGGSAYHSSDQDEYIQQASKLDASIQVKTRKVGAEHVLEVYRQWVQKYMGVMSMESAWLLVWNAINYFLMGVVLVEALFILLYNTIAQTSAQIVNFSEVIRFLVLGIYLLDMLLVRHRVSVQVKGKFVKEGDKLLMLYVRKLLLADLLSLVFTTIGLGDNWYLQYLRILVFAKYLTGVEIDGQIRYKLDSFPFVLVIYSFFKFILGLVFWTTLYACIYLIIDFYFLEQHAKYYQHGLLWLTGSPSLHSFDLYDNFTWEVWFEYALFFVLQTMRGCGYGVVTPRNPTEFFFANCAILTTMAMFAYFTKRIIDISVAYSIEREELLGEATSNLRGLHETYKFSEAHTRKYLDQIVRAEKKSSTAIEGLAASSFSQSLKQQHMHSFRIHFVHASVLIREISANAQGQVFRMELCQVIHQKKTFKGEYLYRAGVVGDQTLYLTEEGRVVIQNKQFEVYRNSDAWELFGVRQFFVDKRPIFDIICTSTLRLYLLKRQEFMRIIRRYRGIFERYSEQMESMRINRGHTEKLGLSCWHCKKYHLVEQCLHWTIYRDSLPMFRTKLQRKSKEENPRVLLKRGNMKTNKQKSALKIKDKDCYFKSKEYFIYNNL